MKNRRFIHCLYVCYFKYFLIVYGPHLSIYYFYHLQINLLSLKKSLIRSAFPKLNQKIINGCYILICSEK